MFDLKSEIITQKLKWIIKYLNNHANLWRNTMEQLITVKNIGVYLHSNFNKSKIYKYIKTEFYAEIINYLHDSQWSPFLTENLNMGQILYYNKLIKINNKTIYNHDLYTNGIRIVADLFDDNSHIISFEDLLARGVNKKSYLMWRSILYIVREYDITDVKYEQQGNNLIVVDRFNKYHNLLELKSKQIYDILVDNTYIKPTGQMRYSTEYNVNDDDWKRIYIANRKPKNNKVKDM